MARSFVQAGRRRQFTAHALHKAGDLVYADGFFGVMQDDVRTVGDQAMHILDGVWDLALPFRGDDINPGVIVYAAKTPSIALTPYPAGSAPSGGFAIGRSWATYVDSASGPLRTVLFGPENQS